MQASQGDGRPCAPQMEQWKPCPVKPCYSWRYSAWSECRVQVRHTHTHTHARTHARTHMHTHTHRHTHTHTQTQKHKQTHRHTQLLLCFCFWWLLSSLFSFLS